MKQVLVVLAVLCLGSLQTFASDAMRDEVVCNTVRGEGEADNGLTLVLRGNETSWVKVVAVYENGYLGSRQIANVQVPLQPEVRGGGRGYIPEVDLVYRGSGLALSLRALRIDGLPLTGKGEAELALPGYEILEVSLNCETAK